MPKVKIVHVYDDPPGGSVEIHSDGSVTIDVPGQPRVDFMAGAAGDAGGPAKLRKKGGRIVESTTNRAPYKFTDPRPDPNKDTWTEFDPGPPVKIERKTRAGKVNEEIEPVQGMRKTKFGGTWGPPVTPKFSRDLDDDLPFVAKEKKAAKASAPATKPAAKPAAKPVKKAAASSPAKKPATRR